MNVELVTSLDELFLAAYPTQEPGATVIAVKGGEVHYRKAFGMANLELRVPMAPDMVFRIGSITKQFTAVAILMLMEQGKLALDDPITRFLPDYPTHDHIITVEHLLTHTSGIQSYTGMKEWPPLMRKDFTVQEMIDFFKYRPMQFAPGKRWAYNNSGYFLLGAIIERVSEQPYARFVNERIFEPLGMRQSYYDEPAPIISRRAAGYELGPNGFTNAAYLSMTQPYAAGSLASTVDDLALWDAALYTDNLLRQETLQRAFTPYRLNDGTPTGYGYGWAIGEYEGLRTVEHGGGINGFITQVMRIPEVQAFVAVLSNRSSPSPSPSLLALQVAGLILGHPYQIPPAVALDVEALKPFIGVYRFDDGEEIMLVLDSDQLCIKAEPSPVPLVPFSEREFYVKLDPTSRVTFSAEGMRQAGRFGVPRVAKKTDIPPSA